jgi:hypothetical protein
MDAQPKSRGRLVVDGAQMSVAEAVDAAVAGNLDFRSVRLAIAEVPGASQRSDAEQTGRHI